MKKFLLVFCLALIAVAFVACAPKVRVLTTMDLDNDGTDAFTKVVVTIDETEFDIKGLLEGQYTDYDKVEKGEEHIIFLLGRTANTLYQSNYTTNHTPLKSGKKYTYDAMAQYFYQK